MAHVLGVELHLDGDAVEAELGVQQVCGLVQHGLSVCSLFCSQTTRGGRKTTQLLVLLLSVSRTFTSVCVVLICEMRDEDDSLFNTHLAAGVSAS